MLRSRHAARMLALQLLYWRDVDPILEPEAMKSVAVEWLEPVNRAMLEEDSDPEETFLTADWLNPGFFQRRNEKLSPGEETQLETWLTENEEVYLSKTLGPVDVRLLEGWRQTPLARSDIAWALRLVEGIGQQQAVLDPLLEQSSSRWRPERMHPVDRNIIRIGLYELLHEPDTPPVVIINECVQLAREMADEDAWRIVNGILDAVKNEYLAEAEATCADTGNSPGG